LQFLQRNGVDAPVAADLRQRLQIELLISRDDGEADAVPVESSRRPAFVFIPAGLLRKAQRMDGNSTLIRRAVDAVTYPDMVTFVRTLEERPVMKLLDELPDLARLSATKFDLAMKTLRRRFHGHPPIEQVQLQVYANEVADDIEDIEVAQRVRSIFSEPG